MENQTIRLLRGRDPRIYDVPVRSGQFALARLITIPEDFTEGGPVAEFHLLTSNPGKDKQKPARVNDSGLRLALSEQALRGRVLIVDRPEADKLVNEDLDLDLALHPDDLIGAIRRIVIENALAS